MRTDKLHQCFFSIFKTKIYGLSKYLSIRTQFNAISIRDIWEQKYLFQSHENNVKVNK